MSRKLATIQKIKNIFPIPGADKIEVAEILGWKVVVKKGEFQVGDLCVYCEIDSILPEKPKFEFLRDKKFRIKTCRLRGQISQGICFPLNILSDTLKNEVKEGEDVTELLGIEQHIPQIPACIAGIVKGLFPSFIPKTDETRVQVLQSILDRYKGEKCYITEKVDGSSVTYYIKDGEFGVCSRNLELKEDDKNAFWEFAHKINLKERMLKVEKNFAIQGELIGAGIQKNNLRLPEKTVKFFTSFDIDKYQYYNYGEFVMQMKYLELETVPIITDNYILSSNIDELVEMSKGFSELNPKVYREGIVIRPLIEKVDLQMSSEWGNGRVSFKVINTEYLLRYEE